MSRNETNNAKRDLMERIIAVKRKQGWTTKQLAALMRVQPDTVNSWGRGASMGLNAQRQTLMELKPPAEERERMLSIAARLRQEAAMSDERAERARLAGAHYIDSNQRRRAQRLRERAAFLETIGATNG